MMLPRVWPRPTSVASKAFIGSLEASIDRARGAPPNPGRPALHRLNRRKYANSSREPWAASWNVTALLPTDDRSHGSKHADRASAVSPAVMGRYVRAAGRIQS